MHFSFSARLFVAACCAWSFSFFLPARAAARAHRAPQNSLSVSGFAHSSCAACMRHFCLFACGGYSHFSSFLILILSWYAPLLLSNISPLFLRCRTHYAVHRARSFDTFALPRDSFSCMHGFGNTAFQLLLFTFLPFIYFLFCAFSLSLWGALCAQISLVFNIHISTNVPRLFLSLRTLSLPLYISLCFARPHAHKGIHF